MGLQYKNLRVISLRTITDARSCIPKKITNAHISTTFYLLSKHSFYPPS
jgi:hypothetical protein